MTVNRDLADLAQSLAGGIDVADGGTGATTASAARAALGAQTENAALTALASVMSSTATAAAQRAALGLDTGNTPDFTGITFGGAGGTLNRWVTGSWSPTLTLGGGADKISSSTAIYARIGTLVFVHAYIVANRGTDTGIMTIGGLPFTVSTAAGSAGPLSHVGYDNTDGYNGGLLAAFKFGEGSTNINCYTQGNSSSWALQGLNGATFMRANFNIGLTLSGCFITSSA